jgi:hypothetical protein
MRSTKIDTFKEQFNIKKGSNFKTGVKWYNIEACLFAGSG